jgi:hypothetical protein
MTADLQTPDGELLEIERIELLGLFRSFAGQGRRSSSSTGHCSGRGPGYHVPAE